MEEITSIWNFKKSVVRSTLVLLLSQAALFPISVAANIIFSRLLEPAQFGIYGILCFFIYTSNYISELGSGAFIVQREEAPTLKECRVVFTLRFLLSLICFSALWLLIPLIRKIFHLSADAGSMIQAFSVIMLLSPLAVVSKSMLQRKLQYFKIGVMDFITAVCNVAIAIILAFRGFGVWSFIIAALISEIITGIGYFTISPWKINFDLEVKALRKILSFGSFFQLSSVVAMARDNTIPVLGGIFFGVQAVGFLTWAYNSTSKISIVLAQIISRVIFPAASRSQRHPHLIAMLYTKSIKYMMIVTAPLMIILFVLSREIVTLIFGPKWLPAIPSVILFGMYHLVAYFSMIGDNIFKGIGKIRKIFTIVFIWTVLIWIGAVILSKPLSFNAVSASFFITSFVPAIWIIRIISRHIHKIGLKEMLLPLWIAALMGVLLYFIKIHTRMNIFSLCALITLGLLMYVFMILRIEGEPLKKDVKIILSLLRGG